MGGLTTINSEKLEGQRLMTLLPPSYALRNLMRRPGRFVQLVLGSAMVVLLFMLATSLNEGMARVLVASGSPDNVILLGAGSEESIERSEVSTAVPDIAAAAIPGLRLILGQPAVSGEVHYNGLIETADGKSRQALLRGVSHKALRVHQEVRILEGRFPSPGEIMVGRLAHHKLESTQGEIQIGKTITFNGADLKVVGVFDAPGTVMEAELWMPVGDLLTLTQRESLSCVVVAVDKAEFEDVDVFSKQRLDLELVAMRESDYYSKLAGFYAPIRWMAWVCAILIATGAIFGGLNTLYAAFASRIQEFGALQAIGFSRIALLISLLMEATTATLIGTMLAGVTGLLCLDGLTIPFSIGAFSLNFDPAVVTLGFVVGISLGLIGSLPPAWSCLSPKLTTTLRSA